MERVSVKCRHETAVNTSNLLFRCTSVWVLYDKDKCQYCFKLRQSYHHICSSLFRYRWLMIETAIKQ
ncbi:hypothetical protein VNO77_05148 [Canavalia gladiata]|uniref:Uncharacterized protein n=1 Tax=Canavalia gladiata TaxID=3824 RepID=A0AAN9R5D6_CANGL